jgi:arylsulfatase A-like enzyme
MTRKIFVILFLVFAAALAVFGFRHIDLRPFPKTTAAIPARIILIGIDTLRADHLSCYGYSRQTSPGLDALAREGVRFENAYSSAPWTLPAMTSIFTSLPPPQHGIEARDLHLDHSVPTLAGAFTSQNWPTSAFITHIFVSHIFGLNSGFQEFQELSIDWSFQEGSQLKAEQLNAHVFPWLDTHRNKKFFLYLHYFDPHWDYDPPAPYDRKFTNPNYKGPASGKFSYLRKYLRTSDGLTPEDIQHVVDLYDGEIAYTDYHLSKLFEKLKAMQMWDDSLVVVLADHGEEFKEHGSFHHHTLYREALHVPVILKPPGGRPRDWRAVVTERMQTIDIGPTLLQMSGLKIPQSFRGSSIIPLMNGSIKTDRIVFARDKRSHSVKSAIIADQFKLIDFFTDTGVLKKQKLFNLDSDPKELYSIEEQEPKIVKQLGKSLLDWNETEKTSAFNKKIRENPVMLDEGQEESLKALGYTD